ncbi:hypothetical protein F7725_009063 [Dissostichus mawsoni]|uniref:PDZ domain-containing protein n=1 Tax=Dissostichus mawsoni TaxID=36200 RepID=A0A7J5Z5X0_DISMA|nr:hypothetical protein F7725_009063 [Dissostichus mawsoni]
MKVTVTFGDTSVVVPCKAGWNVRDLTEQATRRYRRVLEQHGESEVRTHHLEYMEGGILDMDDLLSDLLLAVFEVQRGRTESPRETLSNGYSSAAPSPEPLFHFPHLEYQEPMRAEIEVNEASLKANTPLLVRSSSDSALTPYQARATPPPDNHSNSTLTRAVEFPGDWGPLGIHVIPYCSSLSGRTLGLHIKGIEENSRSKRENLFKQDESIVQINDTQLQDKTFSQAQEVFRQAMTSSSPVRLEVLPLANKPRYEKSLIGQLFTGDAKDAPAKLKSPILLRAKTDSQPAPKRDAKPNTNLEVRRADPRTRTPEPHVANPPAELRPGPGSLERGSPSPSSRAESSSPPRTRSQSPQSSRSPLPGLGNLTGRKGGKKLKIDLKKGTEGLGFTVVTRDSSVHGPGPILVKNILQRGAAVKDGRLQPGDRILEVNGVDMTGRSQEELVAMLRSTRQGESVCVVVARQEDIFLPRELKGEEEGSLVLEDGREQLMYEIPLNESGSAGLGISLKGNKSRETGEDLGIFINVNDQMIAVNGESLLGRSNHAAMETLRHSMSSEGNARGTIQLVVLRAPRQDSRGHSAYQGPSRVPNTEPTVKGGLNPTMANNNNYLRFPLRPQTAATVTTATKTRTTTTASPPPPLPRLCGGNEQRLIPNSPPPQKERHENADDNRPRNRGSKSMDMVADESNMGSMVGQRNEPSAGAALGPTLGLWKSSSLESLQTAVREQSRSHAQQPFHRPRPHMVRGRGANQSFRFAIDKSYDGPSEDGKTLQQDKTLESVPLKLITKDVKHVCVFDFYVITEEMILCVS